MRQTNDLRVVNTTPLITPDELKVELPLSRCAAENIYTARHQIEKILDGEDQRLIVIVGPCSIHDPVAARDYAGRLMRLREELQEHLLIVMRVYFEKPRTSVGWKGLINDPNLDGSRDIPRGLHLARELLLALADMGMPAATEMLDPICPQYIADLISWSAIGARTTESQTHRELASGLSMPVGFKNGTDGSLTVAINGMQAARQPHSFLGIDGKGRASVVSTSGNQHCHCVLRGGSTGPNFSQEQISCAVSELQDAGLSQRVLVDCSHANSNKNHHNQPKVVMDLAAQIQNGSNSILGIMVESNIVAGHQDFGPWSSNLIYGQSITDACIDFPTTEESMRRLTEVISNNG